MQMIRDISYTGEGLIPAPINGLALRFSLLHKESVTDIAVHHMTGTGPPPDATSGQEIGFLGGIDRFHRNIRGLDGIGYHVVPMASGRIYVVSRLDRYGAGVAFENNHLLHLALPGDYSTELPSPEHLSACREAVRYIYEYLGREVPTTPHRFWGNTTCPGDRWAEWVPQLARIEEDDMPLLIKRFDQSEVYVAVFTEKGAFKMHVPNQDTFDALGFDMKKVRNLDIPEFNGFKTVQWQGTG